MGITVLNQIQMGAETTGGDAATPTTLWRGLGVLDDQREIVFPDEHIGLIAPVDRSYIPKLAAGISMASVEATFEQLPYICEAGVMLDTPVVDGTGTGYINTYTFPTAGEATPRSYNFIAGDDVQAEEMGYGVVSEFTLEGQAGEAWMMAAEWFGLQVAGSTFEAALSIPTVEEILFSKTKLYIDATDTDFGTTIVSDVLLAASLKVTTGFFPLFTADGELYFRLAKQFQPEINLSLTFAHAASPETEKGFWRDQTTRLIRLISEGTALVTPDTYTYKTLILDVCGKWERFEPLGDQDGNTIVEAKFKGLYNGTAAKWAEIVVVHELTTLP